MSYNVKSMLCMWVLYLYLSKCCNVCMERALYIIGKSNPFAFQIKCLNQKIFRPMLIKLWQCPGGYVKLILTMIDL